MTDKKDNRESYLQMFKQMVRIRAFEEQANQLYLSAKMPGLTHMYVGQEAVAVGICEALTPNDKITSTHRGHGHCVAKGADFKQMFCELLGKEEGYCRGKGGSMHIADQANGNLGANAIVGGSAGIATGAALSAKQLGSNEVSVCFFGDGALGQGLLYETMNMAALWKLPVIYACENNLYGEYTKVFSRRFIITALQPVAPLINWCLQPMAALSCWWHLQRPGGLVKTMAPLRLTCSLTLRLALKGWPPEVNWLALHTMPLLNMLSSVLDSSTWSRVSGRMV